MLDKDLKIQPSTEVQETNPELRQNMVKYKRRINDDKTGDLRKVRAEQSMAYAAPKILKLKDQARKLKESGVQSYMDWIAGANDIVLAMLILSKVLTAMVKYNHPLENALSDLASLLKNAGADMLDKYGIYKPIADVDVAFAAQVNDEGKMQLDCTLEGKKPSEISAELQTEEIMDYGVNLWLQTQNLKREPDGTLINATTNQKLSLQEITDFRKNKLDSGDLKNFLTHYLEMSINQVLPDIKTTKNELQDIIEQHQQSTTPKPRL